MTLFLFVFFVVLIGGSHPLPLAKWLAFGLSCFVSLLFRWWALPIAPPTVCADRHCPDLRSFTSLSSPVPVFSSAYLSIYLSVLFSYCSLSVLHASNKKHYVFVYLLVLCSLFFLIFHLFASYNQSMLILYLRLTYLMVFDIETWNSLLYPLIRFSLSMSVCHFVNFVFFLSFVILLGPYVYPSCIFTPLNRYPRKSFHPIPQTHQSVGHSTKDDKGPEGMKWGNGDSRKKVKERAGEKGKWSKQPFPQRQSPFRTSLWHHGSYWLIRRH